MWTFLLNAYNIEELFRFLYVFVIAFHWNRLGIFMSELFNIEIER